MARSYLKASLRALAAAECRLRIYRGSELLSRPSPQWLVERMIGIATLVLLHAPPNVGKTFLALYIALAIANDLRCFGDRNAREGCVVYVAAEGGAQLKRRLQAWIAKHPT